MTPLHSAALFGRQRALLRVDLDVGSIVPPKDCVQQGRAPRFEEIMGFSVRPCTSILRELRDDICMSRVPASCMSRMRDNTSPIVA